MCCGAATTVASPAPASPPGLPDAVTQWLATPAMRHATVAIEVRDLATGRTVCELDADRAVQPASVMKLVTTGAALRLLGADHRAPTEVLAAGPVVDGALRGDLIIRGHGDAMLASMWSLYKTTAFAGEVVGALRREGIRRIEGCVVGDGTALTGNPVPSEWTWEDMGNHYAPAISGLNYGDNRVVLTFDASRPAAQPRLVRVTPELPGVTFDNRLSSRPHPFDSAYVYGAPGDSHRTIYGAIPHGKAFFDVKADVPDPAAFAAQRIAAALRAAGIAVLPDSLARLAPERSAAHAEAPRLLCTHSGEPLSYVVRQTNVNSLNLMAEMCLRQVALQDGGDGSETAGIRAVLAYWHGRGLRMGGVRMFDGCGLAPADRVTARFVCDLLAEMQDDEAFVASLAVAGRTGTVAQFLKGSRLEGKAWLKTGTTKAVIAYAGYATGSDGRRYAVTLIVNNHEGRAAALRKDIEAIFPALIP